MSAVNIERIEAIPLRIPMDHGAPPPLFAGRPRTTIDTLLVRVTTNRDVVGWGEAYGGGWQATVAALDHWVSPLALGQDATDVARADLAARGFFLARGAAACDRRADRGRRERNRGARLPQDDRGRRRRLRAAERGEDRRAHRPVAHLQRGGSGWRHLRAARTLFRPGLFGDAACAGRKAARERPRALLLRAGADALRRERAGRRWGRRGARRPGFGRRP